MYLFATAISILFLLVIIFIFRLKTIEERYADAILEKEEAEQENGELKKELEKQGKIIESMYKILKNMPAIDEKILRGLKDFDWKFHDYIEFEKRVNEEIERKRRYEFVKFSILSVALDFFDEYKKMNKENLREKIREAQEVLTNSIRKIDFLSESRKEGVFYILLPMTDLVEAIVLSERIHQTFKEVQKDNKNIFTMTAAICEVEKALSFMEIEDRLNKLVKEGMQKGGNETKVDRI